MPPGIAHRIVLIEQMIFFFIIYQPVGIVHPIVVRRKMKLRAERFFVSGFILG
jgi:hypothetical protein